MFYAVITFSGQFCHGSDGCHMEKTYTNDNLNLDFIKSILLDYTFELVDLPSIESIPYDNMRVFIVTIF